MHKKAISYRRCISWQCKLFKVKVTEIKSFRVVKDKIRKIFPQKSKCEILAILAFGDGVGTEEMNALHHKLELICSTNINGPSCKTFKP